MIYGSDVEPRPDSRRSSEMRASDAERERVVDVLREAAADGRLTMDEHAERMDQAYASKTVGELARLTTDLPGTSTGVAPEPTSAPESQRMLACFGNESRKGRWVVPGHLRAVSVCGDCHIDMREAQLGSRTIVEATAVLGAVTVIVPEGVRVRLTGTAVFGAKNLNVPDSDDPEAPVVDIQCMISCGSVTARAPQHWLDRAADHLERQYDRLRRRRDRNLSREDRLRERADRRPRGRR